MASQPGIPVYAGGSYAEENFGRVDTYGGELSLTWRDKVGQVNYNIGMDFGLNGSRVKEWVPGLRYNKYPSSSSWEEGMSTYLPVWGFKVWKGTSNGDGILRTQDDINRYWSYLESYTPEGGQTKYLDKTSKDDLRPGMLAYQDLGAKWSMEFNKVPTDRLYWNRIMQSYVKRIRLIMSRQDWVPAGKDLLSVPISLLHGVEYAL